MAVPTPAGDAGPFASVASVASVASSSAVLAACLGLTWYVYRSKFGSLPRGRVVAGASAQLLTIASMGAVAFFTLLVGRTFASRLPGVAVLLVVGYLLFKARRWTRAQLERDLGPAAGRANAYLIFLVGFACALTGSLVALAWAIRSVERPFP